MSATSDQRHLTGNLARGTVQPQVGAHYRPTEDPMERTVPIPVSLLKKLQVAARATEEAQDALDDFLLSRDPRFLERMRASRASHRAGRTKLFSTHKSQ